MSRKKILRFSQILRLEIVYVAQKQRSRRKHAQTAGKVLWMIMSVHTGRMLGIRHDYVIIHVDLLIVIAETVCVLKQFSPLLTALCIAALIIVNRKPVSRMMKGILPS